jgi:hypothetical protein
MQKINVTTVSAVATSATVVQAVIPEHQKSKAVNSGQMYCKQQFQLWHDSDCGNALTGTRTNSPSFYLFVVAP